MRVYLDHAATTPLRPEVREAMLPYLTDPELMGNPSSLHALGRKAADVLSTCHDRVAKVFACKHDDVVFNSGGSEGATHALVGVALMLGKPIHLAVSAIEHKCVLHAADRLVELGHRVSILPVNGNGVVPLEAVDMLLQSDKPDLISVMAINNEVGTVQPIGEIAKLCKEHSVLFHTDAVQAVGHGFSDIMRNQDIPLLTCSGHKFGGPRGTGLLIQRDLRLPALVCGGLQEHGCRAGTENIAGVIGLVHAFVCSEDSSSTKAGEMTRLHSLLENCIRELLPNSIIHGEAAKRSCHVTSVALPGCNARSLLKQLDRKGIACGLGSACTGCSSKVSHVLDAMEVVPNTAEETLRFSLGWSSTEEDVEELLGVLGEML